jgi:gamma-glutamylcyclotransferase (GGCT)/AIG2-like uncharacterized protein YtfP
MRIVDIIIEAGGEPIYYFAYGMLTEPSHMRGARFVDRAALLNYKFEFRKYANIVETAGSQTDGVLWELPTDMIRELDQVEGYPSLYGRKTVPVYTEDGQRYEAWVYYMTPETVSGTKRDRMPSNSYVTTILNGYRHAGIASQQVNDAYYEIIDEVPRSGK